MGAGFEFHVLSGGGGYEIPLRSIQGAIHVKKKWYLRCVSEQTQFHDSINWWNSYFEKGFITVLGPQSGLLRKVGGARNGGRGRGRFVFVNFIQHSQTLINWQCKDEK
jgi:hypothetical protein